MKKMKKLVIAYVALLACVSSFAGIANLNTVAAETDPAFYIKGASVRTSDPSGIRFHTIVENKKDGYAYGTLLIPEADFTGDALTVDTTNVVDIPAINWKSETEYTTALGGVEKDGVISNFPKSQYNKPILACSYEKDTAGTVTYTETVSRTLAQVASAALTDTREDYAVTDTEDRKYLIDICDYVLGEDGFALAQTSVNVMVGETLDLSSVFATNNGNEGLKAIWSVVEGGEYITVQSDEIGAVTAIGAKADGTAVLAATIGSYEVELTVNAKVREVAANEVVDFKYATDLQRANVGNGGSITAIEYLDEFEGANGVVKVTHNGWSNLTFDPLKALSEYEGYEYLVVRAYLNANDIYSQALYIAGYKFDHCTTTKVANGVWKDYYFDAELFREQWQDLGSSYSALGFKSSGISYIDKIYMTNTAPHTLINFDSESDLENFSVSEGSTVTWLEEDPFKAKVASGGSNDVELTGGAAKINYSGSTSHSFTFNLPNSVANYKDYNYVTFYMIFPTTSATGKMADVIPQGCGKYVATYMGSGYKAWISNQTLYCWAWTFEIGNFFDNGTATVNLASVGTGAGEYYISDIYVSKDITNANLDVTVNGDIRGNAEYYQSVKAGDTFSIAMFNPEKYPSIDMIVTDPNSNKISDIGNITAVAGTYTITFKHNQWSQDSGYYDVRQNNGGCYSKNGVTKTITFTVKA